MPVTPFHFGPGTLVKSITPRFFSLRAFILVQIVIDCETAWNFFRGNEKLHTIFHSYLGSMFATLISFILIFGFNFLYSNFKSYRFDGMLFQPFETISALTGLLFGAWSHVFLDSIMHADLRPFFPFNESQPTLAIISWGELHVVCLVSFAIAGFIFGMRQVIFRLYKHVFFHR